MVDLAAITMVRDIVTILGVVGGFTYYVMTVRNANRARKNQIIMEIRNQLLDKETIHDRMELLETSWNDYDDFLTKYDSTVNIENYAKRLRWWHFYDGIGYQISLGLIDLESVYYLLGPHSILLFWNKFKSIIVKQRELFDNPEMFL